jgi:ferrous iron transport protein A
LVTLADVPQDQNAEIVWIHDPTDLGDRLMEMGLTPGAAIAVTRRWSRAQPLQVRVRGYVLSLRHDEAQRVEVRLVEAR